MKDWNDGSNWTEQDWKDLVDHPEPPDDPDENSEFQELVFFENGQMKTVRRKNPRYRGPRK